MIKQEKFSYSLLKVLGVLIVLLSFFYLYNSGYYVWFYDEIIDKVAFVYPITRSSVVIEFVIWIIIFLCGVWINTVSRKKLENFNCSHLKVLGFLIVLLSSYYMYKSGYHVLFYDETGGKDVFVFHFTRSFSEVVIEFIFWIIIFFGGLGISTDSRNGLLLGLMAACVALIPSLVYVIIAAGKVRTYSRSILINNTEREMTNQEKWDYIYADLFLSICLTLLVIATIVIIVKRRKYLEVTKQNTIPQQSL